MPAPLIRPFDPARDDYDALAALWTALHPDLPRAGAVWRIRDAEPPRAHAPVGRFIALHGEQLVGLAEYQDCPMAGEPGQLQVTYAARPGEGLDAILEGLHEAMQAAIRPHDPPALVGYARDAQRELITFFERHGFEPRQRTASSLLRPAAYDGPSLGETLAQQVSDGVELRSAADLAAADPDWVHRHHALEAAVVPDIPFLGPVHAESFERFIERIEDPTRFNPRATFVAREIATGEHVGASQLLTWTEMPDYAFAALTGVRRSHRRRGLARALKCATIAYAREHGIERIVSLNEVDNPMLALNRELGFEVQHVQLTMQKRLRG